MKLSKEFIAMFREEAKKARCEINCWNGKSIDDLVCDCLERKELKPDDFQDAVILTVEEAKRWMRILYDNAEHLDCLYECCKDDYLFLQELSNRIEQAEGK